MMWGTDYGTGGWVLMMGSLVGGVVVLAGIVVGVVWLVRSQQTADPVGPRGPTAQTILDARYARGEINESQLMQARQVLAPEPRIRTDCGLGSGVEFDGKGDAVTNDHVGAEASPIEVHDS